MKSAHPVITLLGNNSGRNLGDAAILSAIMERLSDELPGVEFLVPSTHPHFIEKHYGKLFNVRAVNVMPWTGSIRLLGLPTLNCLRRSDAALICDGIIFGKGFYNPAFNFLVTLGPLVPWMKLTDCKLICYSCGIGPFPSKLSRRFARYVIDSSSLVLMRDQDSVDLARELGVSQEMSITGDAAFINSVSSEERAEEIAKENQISLDKPILGVNITSYIDTWLSANERISNRSQFVDQFILGLNQARERSGEELQIVFFSTQPMDEAFTREVASRLEAPVIDNTRYLSHDIQAIMQHCAILVGMRFHSLVLSSAVGVPVVGLVYAPKVKGYMRLLDCERFAIELGSLTAENLSNTLSDAWNNRDELREKQQRVVSELKRGAHHAGTLLREVVFPELVERAQVAA